MKLGYDARRRWSMVILLVGLPVYIVLAVAFMALFDRPSPLLECLIYIALGILWALPFRMVFRGIGQPEPKAGETPPGKGDQGAK